MRNFKPPLFPYSCVANTGRTSGSKTYLLALYLPVPFAPSSPWNSSFFIPLQLFAIYVPLLFAIFTCAMKYCVAFSCRPLFSWLTKLALRSHFCVPQTYYCGYHSTSFSQFQTFRLCFFFFFSFSPAFPYLRSLTVLF